MRTQRLTMAQALVAFLKQQYVERDGREFRFFHGAWGIFGHGCIAGLGQALQQNPDFRYYQCKNEQAGVHIATAFAKAKNRLGTFTCISSIGPGATNMITGAATATINRLPVLLLPGDIFSRRNVAPVLQQLESEHSQDISVNDAFKPVSRYWDRINRPDQLICSGVEAMRVLTSPSQTGAVTLALPQDVQSEAWDYPEEMFAKRVWHIARQEPERAVLLRAVETIRSANGHSSSPAAASCTAKRRKRWLVSLARRVFRWEKPRPARERCPSMVRRAWARLGSPVLLAQTWRRATPMSSSRSARG